MLLNVSKREEDSTQHGENQCLNETYKDFEEHHEDTHRHTNKRHRHARKSVNAPHDKDDAGKRQSDSMSRHHVGEETNHQCKRLGEDTKEFNERHDSHRICLEPRGHFGPENLLPRLLRSRNIHHDECTEGEEERAGDVSREVSAKGRERNDAQHVGGEDEEETREQVGGILGSLLS